MNRRFIEKNIWLSKAAFGDTKLNTLLKEQGLNVLNLPLIELSQNDTEQIKQSINSLNEYDWIILPSPNAVFFLYQAIIKNPKVRLDNITAKFCFLGNKTRIKARLYGITSDHYCEETNIEKLLCSIPLNIGQKILYFTSDKTNNNIDLNCLTDKKGSIRKEVLYRNKPNIFSSKELNVLNQKQIDLIIVYSYSAIDALCLNATALNTNVYDTPLMCIGPLTAEYAKTKQFQKVKYSRSIEDKDILKACMDYL